MQMAGFLFFFNTSHTHTAAILRLKCRTAEFWGARRRNVVNLTNYDKSD